MFLGTPRYWWIITIVIFVLALAFIGTDLGGDFGTVLGILMLFLSMILFAASPMRRRSQQEPMNAGESSPAPEPAPEAPPRPRPEIVGRDASEV